MKKYILFVLCPVLALISFSEGTAKPASFYAPASQLSSGKWIKVRVNENAIYKLTYEDIQAWGIDPAKARVYGYGGWKLNQIFSQNDYTDDLPEVPVWISGTDQVLNPGEFILFYGKGHTKWTVATPIRAGEFKHENNPYSDYGYYFIGEKETPLKVVETAAAETPGTPVETFNDYALHERDLEAIIPSGRELYGENFASNSSLTFPTNINNIVSGENMTAEFRFLTTATVPGSIVSLSTGDKNLVSHKFRPLPAETRADTITKKASWPVDNGAVNLTVSYSPSGYNAYLDYIRLFMKRHLKPDGAYTFFRNVLNITDTCTYKIGNASPGMFVLELTEGKEIKKMPVADSGNGTLSFHAEKSSRLREFVLINPAGSFPVPEFAGNVQNQNLHALPQQDLVIITQPVFWEEARKLAEKHISHSGLKVAVVMAEQVYNEFSSGTPDATAYRRLMKMFYDRAANEEEKPKYLLLFGDGAHDNRMLTGKWKQMSPDHYLLTFQSENSTQPDIHSYTTDDYFSYLDDTSGNIPGIMQLGVGRFPVKTQAEAAAIVNKEIDYMDNKNPGIWKNQLVFLAGDDKTENLLTHVLQSDGVSSEIDRNYPNYMVNKVYYDAFKQSTSVGNVSYPDAQRKLDKKLKEGAFLLNYVGHGAATQIDKNMVTASSAGRMSFANLPLWIMSTCEVGRWDETSNSMSEILLLNPVSGGIAVISSARIVYSDQNEKLNVAIFRHLFATKNNSYQRLGDILRNAKNDISASENKLCYALLGDPALKLSYPESTIYIDSVNGLPVADNVFQFKARDTVVLKGSIVNALGVKDTEFAGKLQVNVMDAPQEMTTLRPNSQGNVLHFNEYLNNIYNGACNVVNGEFTTRFVIPVDISHSEQFGKMNLYAFTEAGGRDANGSFSQFFLKGVTDNEAPVSESPQIHSVFLNSSAFQDGGTVNEKPYFMAEISDNLGINRSGVGIGHDIMLIIDNKPMYSYNLNEYFVENEENPGHGTVYFSIPDSLPSGHHRLTFKVWNILNISTTRELSFVVEAGKSPVIYTLNANPNPARMEVSFTLYHDPLPIIMNEKEVKNEVKVAVYDLTGRMVWESEPVESPGQEEHWIQIPPIRWNLLSNTGNRVKPGVYLYKAIINNGSGREATTTKKLIVLAQ
jgi:hypothetical protein